MRPMIRTLFAVIFLDQFSKILVVQFLDLKSRGVIEIFPPFLTFRMAWNRGVNFGLFSSGSDATRWILIVLSIGIAAWVAHWVLKDNAGPRAFVSAGLLIGGALGNVIDRLVYGAVADFLNMSCCGFANPFAFNIADVAIFVGAVGLILFTGAKKSA